MQFDNVQTYIDQAYGVELDTAFLNKNVHSLMYLKLVRLLSKLRIETTGVTAEALFAEAVQVERNGRQQMADLMFQLADLHAEIELLIVKSGKVRETGFDAGVWERDINS
ncbi:hypothetical protein [Pseudomonas phage D6]|nr:hypothetical protein [Pseudomonas phage D6]